MRLASIPKPEAGNPFALLLYGELERLGIEPVGGASLAPGWLWRRRRDVDVVHLNWPEHEFLRRGRLSTAARLALLTAQLAFARLLGYRVAWTLHNLDPHEQTHPALARVGMLAPAWLASHVFAHDTGAADELRHRTLRRRRVFVAPHGNYLDWYPERAGRPEARARLGLGEDEFVFLMLGRMQAYKGVPDALEAFSLAGRPSDRLVLAGLFKDDSLRCQAKDAAAADGRIAIVDRVLADDELPVFFGAADVAVLPFRRATTSGSALLALGFGVPVIATSVGNVSQLVTPACGLLVPPGDVTALAAALSRIRDLDLVALGRGARERAEAFTWRAAAETIAGALGP